MYNEGCRAIGSVSKYSSTAERIKQRNTGYDLMIATEANSANPFGLDSISLSHLNSQILLYKRMIRRSAMMTSSLVLVRDEESVSV